jgi:hypothetical protein
VYNDADTTSIGEIRQSLINRRLALTKLHTINFYLRMKMLRLPDAITVTKTYPICAEHAETPLPI